MAGIKSNLKIPQGRTFSKVYRWGQERLIYKPITAMPTKTPVTLTVVGHGMPDGWAFQIAGVDTPSDLNSKRDAWYKHTAVDTDTVEINNLNGVDFSDFDALGGGVIIYHEPHDLSGFTARAQVRSAIDSTTTILDLTSAAGDIILDNTEKTITVQISATDTAALDIDSAVWDLELEDGSGKVYLIAYGEVVTEPLEVTR